jgi:Carbamoyl-phosphate synthase L chain, ATP binding domain
VKPTVLVVTTPRWVSTARLVVALANAGCKVEAVCPPGHPLEKTRSVRRLHPYRGLAPLTSFADAISSAKADIIISGDDLATRHLHDLYHLERRHGRTGGPICTLIERSLGAPESYPVVYARSAFMELAEKEGVRVPKTTVIANIDEVEKCVYKMGFPVVLKTNGSSGGFGVRIVHTVDQAKRAFRTLHAPPLLSRVVKHTILDRDMTLIRPLVLRRRPVVNAQAFVAGREATSLVACSKGGVLAGLHFEVINKDDSTGPATVLRLIENPEMSAATEKMVGRLKLSGLHGFDFMLEAHTGNAYLIEINSRATQVGHLTLGPGRDLPAALCAAVSGEIVRPAPRVTDKDTIALFPQEWLRNPASPFLRTGYHDVPWEEPDLIRTSVRRPRNWSAWYSQQKWVQAFSEARIPRS